MKKKYCIGVYHSIRVTKILFAFLVLWLITSCVDQAQQREPLISGVDLDQLPWVDSRSELDISLWTSDGIQVVKPSLLKPGASYDLKVKSEVPLGLRIKIADGFIVEGSAPSLNFLAHERTFKIRTVPELTEKIYLNIVPLHYRDDRLIRERPQSFLLPVTD